MARRRSSVAYSFAVLSAFAAGATLVGSSASCTLSQIMVRVVLEATDETADSSTLCAKYGQAHIWVGDELKTGALNAPEDYAPLGGNSRAAYQTNEPPTTVATNCTPISANAVEFGTLGITPGKLVGPVSVRVLFTDSSGSADDCALHPDGKKCVHALRFLSFYGTELRNITVTGYAGCAGEVCQKQKGKAATCIDKAVIAATKATSKKKIDAICVNAEVVPQCSAGETASEVACLLEGTENGGTPPVGSMGDGGRGNGNDGGGGNGSDGGPGSNDGGPGSNDGGPGSNDGGPGSNDGGPGSNDGGPGGNDSGTTTGKAVACKTSGGATTTCAGVRGDPNSGCCANVGCSVTLSSSCPSTAYACDDSADCSPGFVCCEQGQAKATCAIASTCRLVAARNLEPGGAPLLPDASVTVDTNRALCHVETQAADCPTPYTGACLATAQAFYTLACQ